MILPQGAKAIVAARAKGMKPADMIIVSLIGPPNEANPIVHANPVVAYDWRWVVGLQVCLYAYHGTPWRDIAMTIARCRPQWLGLWLADTFEGAEVYALPKVDDIDKSPSQWRWSLHFIPWMDFQNHAFAWDD
jgi:hypothetical protein